MIMSKPIKIVDVSTDKRTYMSYRSAIKLVTDWDTLAELAEEFTRHPDLTDEDKDALVELANAKERELRSDGFIVRFTRRDA